MRDILLGVDIGTSACKAAAFDGEGRVVAQAAGAYDVSCPHPGWAEQDPEQWWEAVCRAIREVLEAYHREYRCSYLLITHDMKFAYSLSQRIYELEHGQIIRIGQSNIDINSKERT